MSDLKKHFCIFGEGFVTIVTTFSTGTMRSNGFSTRDSMFSLVSCIRSGCGLVEKKQAWNFKCSLYESIRSHLGNHQQIIDVVLSSAFVGIDFGEFREPEHHEPESKY